MRVREDIERHEEMLRNLQGTMIRLAKMGNPSTLKILERAGFDGADMQAFAAQDENDPPCCIKIRESSVKYRSNEEKKQDLMFGVQSQAISATEYRRAMASDLDTPLTQDDAFMGKEANRAAMRCLAGRPWQPIPLGQYQEQFIMAFRKALLSPRAMQNPQIGQLLIVAIQSQMQVGQIEMQMSQPPQPEQAAEGGQAQADPVQEIMASLSGNQAA
jgi:hypothetical protein